MKYEHIPQPKNNKAKRLSVWLLIGGALVFLAGGFKFPGRVVLQVLSLCMLTSSIMLIGRFLLRAYCYKIEDFGEGDELLVDEITKSLRYTVCRLKLSDLIGMYKKKECPKELMSKKHYNYCPDPFTDEAYILVFRDGEDGEGRDPIIIKILPDQTLFCMLEQVLKKNKDFEDAAEGDA